MNIRKVTLPQENTSSKTKRLFYFYATSINKRIYYQIKLVIIVYLYKFENILFFSI